MILDLLEIWLAVTGAFAVGAFAGALLHDWLAGSRVGAGQAAFAEVVAMGVEGSRRAIAARRGRRIERLTRARGHAPPAEDMQAAAVPGQLDRIAGMEPAMAARLSAAGYGRLDQLRRWSDEEQVWIADMLGVRRRESTAGFPARRGSSAPSRRRSRRLRPKRRTSRCEGSAWSSAGRSGSGGRRRPWRPRRRRCARRSRSRSRPNRARR